MLVFLIQFIIINALIGVSCYARGLYLELKATKEKLEKAYNTIHYLERELQTHHRTH